MGYTHYWKQKTNIDSGTWATIAADVQTVIAFAQAQGIMMGDGCGEGSPDINAQLICFNGVGEQGYESFYIERIRKLESWQTAEYLGWGSCKTARHDYDPVITGVLCYLSTVTETHTATSDGKGRDWLAGLELARAALPRYANLIDVPMDIMRADRWVYPWLNNESKRYSFKFCIDRKAYIFETANESCAYQFPSWLEAAEFAVKHREIIDSSGSYDRARHERLERQCDRLLGDMIAFAPTERLVAPMSHVRPDAVPETIWHESEYWAHDLVAKLTGTKHAA